MPSVTAAPDGRVVINDTGNAAAATAGTGDVLAGMTAGLLSQGLEPFEAAFCAVHIGGAIADEWVETRDARSMMATDVVAMIPEYLKIRD
jgi:NAD(P)H-hydrate epimerase